MGVWFSKFTNSLNNISSSIATAILICSFIVLPKVNSNVITKNQAWNGKTDGPITCLSTDTTCTVYCQATTACGGDNTLHSGPTINCPTNADCTECNIYCTFQQSCIGADIIGNNCDILNIYVPGKDNKKVSIYAPSNGGSLNLAVYGPEGKFKESEIYSSSTTKDITISCSGLEFKSNIITATDITGTLSYQSSGKCQSKASTFNCPTSNTCTLDFGGYDDNKDDSNEDIQIVALAGTPLMKYSCALQCGNTELTCSGGTSSCSTVCSGGNCVISTAYPTTVPTLQPTVHPTVHPSVQPSRLPSLQPSIQPSLHPSIPPSLQPSLQPSIQPSMQPSNQPSQSTASPSQPTENPSQQTSMPSFQPTFVPSSSTNMPSFNPTYNPSFTPTNNPTTIPSYFPSKYPSIGPTVIPTNNPTTQPTFYPSQSPTFNPTNAPSMIPSLIPTNPSIAPSIYPTTNPTYKPSNIPTTDPSKYPSFIPTIFPTNFPSIPSISPSTKPSYIPTIDPTNGPTIYPTIDPTNFPSTLNPTKFPSTLLPTNTPTKKGKIITSGNTGNNDMTLIFIAIGVSAFVLACCFIFAFLIYRKRKSKKFVGTNKMKTAQLPAEPNNSNSNTFNSAFSNDTQLNMNNVFTQHRNLNKNVNNTSYLNRALYDNQVFSQSDNDDILANQYNNHIYQPQPQVMMNMQMNMNQFPHQNIPMTNMRVPSSPMNNLTHKTEPNGEDPNTPKNAAKHGRVATPDASDESSSSEEEEEETVSMSSSNDANEGNNADDEISTDDVDEDDDSGSLLDGINVTPGGFDSQPPSIYNNELEMDEEVIGIEEEEDGNIITIGMNVDEDEDGLEEVIPIGIQITDHGNSSGSTVESESDSESDSDDESDNESESESESDSDSLLLDADVLRQHTIGEIAVNNNNKFADIIKDEAVVGDILMDDILDEMFSDNENGDDEDDDDNINYTVTLQ